MVFKDIRKKKEDSGSTSLSDRKPFILHNSDIKGSSPKMECMKNLYAKNYNTLSYIGLKQGERFVYVPKDYYIPLG